MNRFFLLIFMVSFFAGCKQQLIVDLSMSQLKKEGSFNAVLNVELPSCEDYNDSRKASDALNEAAKTVPYVFPGAVYKECYKKQLEAFAVFSIPIAIDTKRDNTLASSDKINLLSGGDIFLSVVFPENISTRLKAENSKPLAVDNELSIVINLTNDTGKPIELSGHSIYVGEIPVIYGEFTFKKGSKATLKLSNVAVDHALYHGYATILKIP